MKKNRLLTALLAVSGVSLVACNGGNSTNGTNPNSTKADQVLVARTANLLNAPSSGDCFTGEISRSNPSDNYYTAFVLKITNSKCTGDAVLGDKTLIKWSANPAADYGWTGSSDHQYVISYTNTNGNVTGSINLSGTWAKAVTLKPGASLEFNGGVGSLGGTAYKFDKANDSMVIGGGSSKSGKLVIAFKASGVCATSACSPAKVTVTNSSNQTVQSFDFTKWNQDTTASVESLPADSYTVSIANANNYSAQANPNPTPVKLDTTSTTNVTFSALPTYGDLVVKVPTKQSLGLTNLPDTIPVQLKNGDTLIGTYDVSLLTGTLDLGNQAVLKDNKPYTLVFPNIGSAKAGKFYAGGSLNIVVKENQPNTANYAYSTPMTNIADFTFNVSGLKSTDTATLQFTDTQKTVYAVEAGVANGGYKIKVPAGVDFYPTVTANGYSSNISQGVSFNTTKGTSTNLTFSSGPASGSVLVMTDTQCDTLINSKFKGLTADVVYCTPEKITSNWYMATRIIYNSMKEEFINFNYTGDNACSNIDWKTYSVTNGYPKITNVVDTDTQCNNSTLTIHRLGALSFEDNPPASYLVGQIVYNFTNDKSVNNIINPKVEAKLGTQNTKITNTVYYHLRFPVTSDQFGDDHIILDTHELVIYGSKTGKMTNPTDLIMSNYISGVLLGHLINKDYPTLQYSKDYLYGTLFAQLMQENINTGAYNSNTNWINSTLDGGYTISGGLLDSGQGGPYQLNDYSKPLENGLGMINFMAMQKSLGYKVADQGEIQTAKSGPASLNSKYFGPVAAAYFHYNDLKRAVHYDSAAGNKTYSGNLAPCLSNLTKVSGSANFLEMILNAVYNAGPVADITKTYVELCANINNPAYANRIANINNYKLNDADYQATVGQASGSGTTYVLYPRQVRFYLDELYNNLGNKTNNTMPFAMPTLKTVFEDQFMTIAIVDKNGVYRYITRTEAGNAFNSALSASGVSGTATLDLSKATERAQIFTVLEKAIKTLESNLGTNFANTTSTDL